MTIHDTFTELEKHLIHHEKMNDKVSSKGVDWHVDHMLKVINGTCHMLKKSDPRDYRWEFSWIRLVLSTFNYIPRGAGRIPKVVTSTEVVSKEALVAQYQQAKQLMKDIDSLPSKSNFKHPYFGLLDLTMTKKFLKIHTSHHLKIVRDIVLAVDKN